MSCVCNWLKWSCYEIHSQPLCLFLGAEMKCVAASESKKDFITFYLNLYLQRSGFNLTLMKKEEGRSAPPWRAEISALGLCFRSIFIWGPVTMLILQGFRSLNAIQVQNRQKRMNILEHRKITTCTQMGLYQPNVTDNCLLEQNWRKYKSI